MKRLAAIFALAIALAVRGTFAATDLGELALASDVTTAVRYVSQPLSDAQKSQARTNIGAVITAPEGYTDWTVTPSHSDMFGDMSIEWSQYGETDWCWAWVGSNYGTIDLTYNENQNATSLSTDFDRTYTATRSPKPGYLFAGDTSHVMAKQSDLETVKTSVAANASAIAAKTLRERDFTEWTVNPDICSAPFWANSYTWQETSPDDPDGQWAADMGQGLEFMGGSYNGTTSLSWSYYSTEYDESTGEYTYVETPVTATRSRLPGYQLEDDTTHIVAKQSDMDALIATNRLLEARIAALESVVTNLEATLHFINTGNQP